MTYHRILYVQYTNPGAYPPLEHQSRILADDGWDVLFLGTGAHGAANLEFPKHERITVRLMSFCQPGWRQKIHYAAYIGWVLATVLVWRPTVVYCSDSFSAPVGLLANLLFRVRVFYHEHDTPGHAGNLVIRIVESARKVLARLAIGCILPNHERAQRFAVALHPRRLFCVWNCPSIQEVLSARTDPPISGRLRLWYHGSLSPGQLPISILEAMALLPAGVTLTFAGYETVGHPRYTAELLAFAERIGVGDRVRFAGTPSTRPELFALAAEADVGLALFPRVFRDPMAGASNKPFDYLACGQSFIVTDTPEWVDMYVSSGYAQKCDPRDPAAIAAVIRDYLITPTTTRVMGEAGRQRVLTEWNYETQFEPLAQFLNENHR